MSTSTYTQTLQSALSALARLGVVPAVADPFVAESDAMEKALYEQVLADVAAFSRSGNPDVLPELQQHLRHHLSEVGRLLGGSRREDLGFVQLHAQRRAEQKFPLDAVLQVYRLLHRTLAEHVRDAALQIAPEDAHVRRVVAAVTEFSIEYTDVIATLLTSEYVSHTRVLSEAEGDRRTELLNTLLGGYDESDQRTAQLLRRSGYLGQRQSYCVAAVRAVNPQEMTSGARVQRMVESVGNTLRNTPGRALMGVKDDMVVAIMSATRRQSGWTAPQTLLAERVYPVLRTIGPAVLIGLSTDVPSTSHIPRALQEARTALNLASVDRRVRRFANIPFRQMLVSSARDSAQTNLPQWFPDFVAADKRGALLETLQSYADNDMNVLKTAEALDIHPNTIYARLQKIEDVTGRNALQYHALTELLLANEYATHDQ